MLLGASLPASASVNVTPFLTGTQLPGFSAFENNAIAVDSSGNVFASGTVNGAGVVVEVLHGSNTDARVYVNASNIGGEYARALTVDDNDNLWILGAAGNIYKVPSGTPANTTQPIRASINQMTWITAVGTNIYVGSFLTGVVQRMPMSTPDGSPASVFTDFATGLAAPGLQGLSHDGKYLLAADDAQFNGGTQSGAYRLDTTAGPYTNPPLWVDTSSTPAFVPVDIAANSNGDVFISDYNNSLLSVPAGSSTASVYLGPVTDGGASGLWSLCIFGSTFYMTGSDSSNPGNQRGVFSINAYNGTASPSGPTTTTTTGSGGLPITGSNTGLTLISAAILMVSGLLLTQGSSRVRRRSLK